MKKYKKKTRIWEGNYLVCVVTGFYRNLKVEIKCGYDQDILHMCMKPSKIITIDIIVDNHCGLHELWLVLLVTDYMIRC